MPLNPQVSEVHIDTALTNFSRMYKNTRFIGQDVVPKVMVPNETGKYHIYDKDDWFRIAAGERAPTGDFHRVGFKISQGSFTTRMVDATGELPDEKRKNADSVLRIEQNTVALAMNHILLELEDKVSTFFTTTGNFTSSGAAATVYTNIASDPFDEISDQIETVTNRTGIRVTDMATNHVVLRNLVEHPGIQEKIKYTGNGGIVPASMRATLVAQLFDLERVHVGYAIKNTSGDGDTAIYSQMWGNHIALFYNSQGMSLEDASFAKRFVWQGYDMTTYRMRDELHWTDLFPVVHQYDLKGTGPDSGHLITTVI